MTLPKIKLNGINALNALGAIVIIYLIVVLGTTVKRNYDLGKQIESLKTEITLLQDQKEQLAYNIQYYNTDAFRDREARSKLGLQLPGENVIIIPRTSPSPSAAAKGGGSQAASKHSNFRQWIDFLSGRS
jgi:cell division protein FtsB